ncbi:MAG: Na+:solute symporter, partial [Armatimonadota bacterium]|nr:Na+:solute symporter [Armatimonadota bacterium]
SIKEYFASGQGTPWWILGTSIVATTFAADTPLAVSGLVVRRGIAGNWYWWNGALMGMFAVFFFSRFWRRANVLTDTELAEARYSGKSAAVLRGFRALYFGLPYNCIIMGWVNLAVAKIIVVTLGLPDTPETKFWAVTFCFFITLIYTALAGITGVMITDFLQFILAMCTSVLIAVLSVVKMGGIDTVFSKLSEIYGHSQAQSMTSIIPTIGQGAMMPISFFLIYIALQWWTSGNTDGGGYAAQRLISAKNEKHAMLGYLWYNIAHFCLRPWPWIVVGLVAAAMFPCRPDATGVLVPDPEQGYIKVMVSVLPVGVLGLAIAGFFAAYMSTIDTQMNWGASYLINDFYKRFIVRHAPEKHYVWASVIATVIIALCGAIVTFLMQSIVSGWELLTQIVAGIGVVYILRWYWWRVNAWSELSALAASLVTSIVLKIFASPWFAAKYLTAEKLSTMPHWLGSALKTLNTMVFPTTLLILVPVCTIVWLTVTFLTKPVEDEKLIEFYKRVRPSGPGWNRIRELAGSDAPHPIGSMKKNLVSYLIGIVSIYSALFGIGRLILGPWSLGLLLLAISATGGYILYCRLSEEKFA